MARSSAAAPATCGAAMLVPELLAYPPRTVGADDADAWRGEIDRVTP